MKTRCKNGNSVERFYDRQSRSSVTRVVDPEGNQIGDADYSGNKVSADYAKEVMIRDNGGRVEKWHTSVWLGGAVGYVGRPATQKEIKSSGVN